MWHGCCREVDDNSLQSEAAMHAFLRDLFDRLVRAAVFADAGNLDEALRLMRERHLNELEGR